MKYQCGVFAFVAVLVGVCLSDDPVCTMTSQCTCTSAQGNIDLTPLASRLLQAMDAKGANKFYYSPCSANNSSPCQDATVCMSDLASHKSIGKMSGENFITQNGQIAIKYPGDENTTSTVVLLKCNQAADADLSVLDDDSKDDYTLQLESRYACVGGPVAQSTTTTVKTTKTSPKTTKTSPKTTKTSPKTTKTSPKTTKTSPKTTKTSPKPGSSTTTPHSTKTSGKTTKTSPKSTSKTTKTSPKSPKTSSKTTKKTTPKNTTPKMKTTTHHGGAASHSSIGLAALATIGFVCNRLF